MPESYPKWTILVPGGPLIPTLEITKDIEGETGLLSIACETALGLSVGGLTDEFQFESFCGETLFLFNQSMLNGLAVLGPATSACLVYYDAEDTPPEETSSVPSSATDELEGVSVGGEDAYSELFDFSGFFLFNQSNVNDAAQVLHDTVLQGHWEDESYITAQLGADPVMTLPPHQNQFV